MAVNIAGLVVLVAFYLLILVIGILATRCFRVKDQHVSVVEASLVAGRSLRGVVSIFTMIATTVGGGYINGTAESVATSGLVWTLAPLGIFLGLNLGGLVYAKRMREKKYITMLDPIQKSFGQLATLLVYAASLWGDLFWTAAILSALGTSLSVIANVPLVIAVCVSAGVTVLYTVIGNMVAVAYTDVAQLALIFIGLVGSVPFVLTNNHVASIETTKDKWLGSLDLESSFTWVDLLLAMTFGTIPWQAYFQRVLSVRGPNQAVLLSVVGAFGAVVFAVPSILIGAAAVSADWSNTSIGYSPLSPNHSEASLVLPLVLKEFTPPIVSYLGLGAISAAVMSSMDSSILGSSAMFTHNIYNGIIHKKASDTELMVVQRLAVVCVGLIATAISLSVPVIYGLFILAADIVYVIILPQVDLRHFPSSARQCFWICCWLCGWSFLRFGAGEPTIGLEPFIPFSVWDPMYGQSFPFRTVAMLCSALTIVAVSEGVLVLHQLRCNKRNCHVIPPSQASWQTREGEEANAFLDQDMALLDKANTLDQDIILLDKMNTAPGS
ncbi:hypothetical protein C0Q70_12799 [Pomacea canaliculata]|uniref:Uncharacterized protein n=1 Tax=Pomacea canaliculata TaxID=400727 RepID=A0A2T7P2I0_POMCA|nr:high-affinity choline transporter 1-like [Pomacea canaliculata]XP_025102130.1 high-affinity choline transporter 1-like [Pomacea canaliculata]PVD27632.1 hypothetical protein C0Q70_12799 [Pomacea canaliculata]